MAVWIANLEDQPGMRLRRWRAVFLTSDMNGNVALSSDLVSRGQRLLAGNGRQIAAKPIAFLIGGTDAAEFAE